MSIITSLDDENQIEFTSLQTTLEVTSGNLGSHLRKLEEHGYITINKTFVLRKPRSYVAPTAKGHQAFAEHVAALADILQQTTHNNKESN